MDRLWAPWRTQYIRDAKEPSDDPSGCFFCRSLAAPRDRDRENLLAWRGPNSVVVLNRFPYNNGHLLVAPRAHLGALGELSGAELTEPVEVVKRSIAVLDVIMRPHGYNVGLNQGRSAGAGLPGHLHWHVVPRWDGDSNFMPVVGDARVVSESLHAFYDRFIAALAPEAGADSLSSS